MISIFIFLIVLLVWLIFTNVRVRNSHFECSSCGKHYQVSFYQFFENCHRYRFGKYYTTCPKCGHSDYLKLQAGKDS